MELPKLSGWAYYPTANGYIEEVESCEKCARLIGVVWIPAVFKGICRGCEAPLE